MWATFPTARGRQLKTGWRCTVENGGVGYSLYIQKTLEAILIKRKSKDGFQAGNLRGNVLTIKVEDSGTTKKTECWLVWRRA